MFTKYHVDLGNAVNYHSTEEQRSKAENQEQVLLNFFLSKADMVRMDRMPWVKFPVLNWRKFSLIQRFGEEDDPEFIKSQEKLKNGFLEKWADAERYHVDQHGNLTQHFLYKLTPEIRNILQKQQLLWDRYMPNPNLYALENPSFYQEKELIGHVISHEAMVELNLSSDEMANLRNKGIIFEDY